MRMFPHQESAAERIAQGIPTYLGFDMGIGKSRCFIEAVKIGHVKRALIICPASAVLVWKREISLWHPTASHIVVKNPHDLKRPAAYYIVTHGLMSQKEGDVAGALMTCPEFDITAIDEAQGFNAPGSQRVKALWRAAPRLGQIVPLSGTPMKNHAGDLFNLISLCYPQGLKLTNGKFMNRYEYETSFCQVSTRNFNGRLVRVIEGSKNLSKLKERIAPFMVRVRKEDVFKDMPPILWDNVPVELDTSMISLADLLMIEAFIEGAKGLTSDSVESILRSAGGIAPLASVRRLLGLAKLRGATEYIDDMLHNLPDDRKVLVFAHHADVIKALVTHLAEYNPAVIVGEYSQIARTASVDKFLNEKSCRVFVGNIQAAGTALTLIGPNCKCSDVVFVESSWTPMDNAQAACRVHRIGQHDGVVARMLSAAGTVDDLINTILVRKARDFTQLFDMTKETEK